MRTMFVALAVLVSSSIQAASITYQANNNTQTGGSPFPQFSPSLGTLAEVDISVTGTLGASFTITKPAPPSFTYHGFGTFIFEDNTTFASIGFDTHGTVSGLLPTDTFAAVSDTFMSTGVFAQSSLLSHFVGTGGVDTGIALPFFTVSDPHVVLDQIYHLSPLARTSLTITYVYLPIGSTPAPSSGIMGVLALVFMGLVKVYIGRRS